MGLHTWKARPQAPAERNILLLSTEKAPRLAPVCGARIRSANAVPATCRPDAKMLSRWWDGRRDAASVVDEHSRQRSQISCEKQRAALLTTRLVSEARVQRAVHVSAVSAQTSAPLRVVSAFHRVGALRLAAGCCCTTLTACLEWVATRTLRQNGSCPESSKRRCSNRNLVVAGVWEAGEAVVRARRLLCPALR